MKLEAGERSILASFHNGQAAEAASAALKQAGFTEVQFDQVGRLGFDHEGNDNRPALGGESSQVSAVMYGYEKPLREGVRVLMAAMPEVSGMSDPGTGGFASFLVTVVTTEERVEEAVGIIRKNGGRV